MDSLYPRHGGAAEIAHWISARIAAGDLAAGNLLPAVRVLAKELGVSPNTVATAYARLREAGLLSTQGRRGTRVADSPRHADLPSAVPAGLVDLSSGNVDSDLLPQLDTGCLGGLQRLSGYDADGDDPGLLAFAGAWMDRQNVAAGEMGVFNGTLDAIERALREWSLPGGSVAVEDPGWPPLLALLTSLRLRAVPLSMDAQGAYPNSEALREACACILTPRAHNPTGRSLSPQRLALWREHLLSAPRCALVIDDYWGPLAEAPLPVGLDSARRWLYVASVSKALGADLRLAVCRGDTDSITRMRRRQSLGPRWVSLLLQRFVAHMWRTGSETFRVAAGHYSARRQALSAALTAAGLYPEYSGEGLHLWLEVSDEASCVQALAARGWAIQAGAPFRLRSAPAVRLSVGNLRPEQIETLARDLREVLRPTQAARNWS